MNKLRLPLSRFALRCASVIPVRASTRRNRVRLISGICLMLALCASFALVPMRVTAQESAAIKPLFVPDELVVRVSNGVVPSAVLEAAGVTVAAVHPTFAAGHYAATLRLKPGASFGRAYWTLQGYAFQPPAALDSLEPNGLAFAEPPFRTFGNRVFNLSTRAEVRQGHSVTIGGVVIPGEFPRLVVFRARGPSLAAFGVGTVLADPKLELYQGSRKILENDNWGTLREFEKRNAQWYATLPPDDPKEAMIVTYLDPGPYTCIVSGGEGGGTGIALLDIYIVDRFWVE